MRSWNTWRNSICRPPFWNIDGKKLSRMLSGFWDLSRCVAFARFCSPLTRARQFRAYCHGNWSYEPKFRSFGTPWSERSWIINPGGRFSEDPVTYRARKAILETMIHLPWKAALLIFFRCKEKQNNCQVSKLETGSYWRYKGIYVTRKVSGRPRNGPLYLSKHSLWLENEIEDCTTQIIPWTLMTIETTGHGDQ